MSAHMEPPTRGEKRFLLVSTVLMVVLIGLSIWSQEAGAATWRRATATWYGPSFYGNAFACSALPTVPNTYGKRVRGTAHMTLPCGTKLTICRGLRCVQVRVIDRGAFHPGNLDLTARTAMDLCGCWKPYTQQVRYIRGWYY